MPNEQAAPPTTAIAEFSQTEAALADLRGRFANLVADPKTTAGMTTLTKARAELRTYRVNLEGKRQELKAPIIERGKLLDSEAKRITAELIALEDPIDQQIKAEETRKANEKAEREQKERERIAAIQARMAEWTTLVAELVGKHSEKVQEAIDAFAAITLDDTFGEFMQSAQLAHARTLAAMRQLHAGAVAQEDAAKHREAVAQRDREAIESARAEQAAREKVEAEEAQRRRVEDDERRKKIEAEQEEARARIAKEQAEARAKIARENEAAHAKAEADRKDREHEEALQRAEREKIEAERREVERLKQELLDGRELLASFVQRFGRRKEFAPIAAPIRQFLEAGK